MERQQHTHTMRPAIQAEERTVVLDPPSLRRHNSCVDFSFVRDKESYNSRKLTKLNAVFERLADRDGRGAPVEELWRLVTAVGRKEVSLERYRALLDSDSAKPPSLPWSPPRGKTGKRLLSRGQFLAIFDSEHPSFVDELVRKVVRDHGKPHSKKKHQPPKNCEQSDDTHNSRPFSSDKVELSWKSDLGVALKDRRDSCTSPSLDQGHTIHRQMTFECHNLLLQDDRLRSESDPCLLRGNSMVMPPPLLDFGSLNVQGIINNKNCRPAPFSPHFDAATRQHRKSDSPCHSPRLVLDLPLCETTPDDGRHEHLQFPHETFVFGDNPINEGIRRHTVKAGNSGNDDVWWDDTLSCDESTEDGDPGFDRTDEIDPGAKNGFLGEFHYCTERDDEYVCQQQQEQDEAPIADEGENSDGRCSFLPVVSLFLQRMSFRRKKSVFALEATTKK